MTDPAPRPKPMDVSEVPPTLSPGTLPEDMRQRAAAAWQAARILSIDWDEFTVGGIITLADFILTGGLYEEEEDEE